ncbi:MAG: TonB system transport protein ExbD [Tardiphaga sp.]|uniref:TonB system transport protein ExbD n=1 Tax=Tardiphaga sp. TaxID=1926292 RepID=UPI00262658AD|nr:TonB system transport protein ExbD [Tardiphaga sp.]MDB5501126.1 TonB system transport protein ExbD [Tardiphaga sp.]
MGARLGAGLGGRTRGSGDDDLEVAHEINVTPFIDVMLVLLIIFMVAAPLATVDLGVDLPASAVEPAPRPDKPVFLTVKPDLSIAVGEDVIARDALSSTLDSATKSNKDERIFLRADKVVSYGDLMEVMNLLRNAGYLKVALVGLDGRSATP